MAGTTTSGTTTPATTTPGRPERGAGAHAIAPGVAAVVAGMSAGAAVIHFAMVPLHGGDSLLDPLAFAAMGWFQLLVAAALVTRRATRAVLGAAIVGNLAIIGLWTWSRVAGLPWGSHAGIAETAEALDLVATGLAAGVVVASVGLLLAPRPLRLPTATGAAAAVAALALATTVIVSPEAGEHGGSAVATGGNGPHGGHSHGGARAASAVGPDAHDVEMEIVDGFRCDTRFNPAAYWAETELLGVDTYAGGRMAHGDGHGDGHGARADSLLGIVGSTPLGGRGSEGLDRLVSLTSEAYSEIQAARLVNALADASDEEYAAWLHWLKASGALDHDHGGTSAAAPDDNAGHGGHVGPQQWKALVDPDECAELAAELELARDVALAHPTAADAMEAGWTMVTPYVSGIAAHYMKFDYVDGSFAVDEPEMLLYDGNGPDARVVGLSYYVTLAGSSEPTQGFTGDNDHYHRHVGLCTRNGVVIGDTTTTAEECAARGGVKADGSSGWMSHAWVVPGCESPWGVFSAANPILDDALSRDSGNNDGGCSASAVRDRYDLSPGRPSSGPGAAPGDQVASGGR